jgi:pimeloyl-ACP methyl ester carboxylesterase
MNTIHYRTARVEDVDIFYRVAGSPDKPAILLLHGFPTSSHMFRDLIPLLAGDFYLVAPDYPGFGYSSTPPPEAFTYTFDHLADVIEQFTDAIGLARYVTYMQDFGGPVGLRVAERRPERVAGLIVQNANAYEAGISAGVRDIVLRMYTHPSAEGAEKLRTFFELPITKHQYLAGVPDPSLVSPDAWEHAQWGMDRPGNKEIQFVLHANYGSNVERYDAWHAYFRRYLPPTLVAWGDGDPVFLAPGADAYLADLPHAQIHHLAAGHFALETNAGEIADLIRNAFTP